MKRFLALLICSVLLITAIPFGVMAETEVYEEITVIPNCDFPDNDQLFAGYVEKTFYPEMAFSTWGRSARDMLSENDKYMYDWMKSNIIKIASGEQTSTVYYADSIELAKWKSVTTYFTSNHTNNFFAQFKYQDVMEALLQDCPYELYWFDKSTGYQLGTSRIGNQITRLVAIMNVSVGYRAANYNEESPAVSVGSTVSVALSNANAVVNKYANLGDYEKLVAYRDEVCGLTDYNYSVIEETDPDYGDPWQLIHVFDGDSSTKVVCEGYSKAFKYLCDKSTFNSSDVSCFSVVGTTNGGGHMWNIVTMPDGKNYIADITNSDSGAIGQRGGLFLKGMSGSPASGYAVTLSKTMTYIYSEDTKQLWGTDSESILNLSSTDYDPYIPTVAIGNSAIVYDGNAITAGTAGADIIYSVQGISSATDYNVNAEWYKDNSGSVGVKMASAPKDAGTYWVKVTATHKTYGSAGSATKRFTVTPASIGITSAKCESKEYDGTTKTALMWVILSGAYESDDVSVSADASFLSAEVGIKTKAKLTNITLTGASADNYKLDNSEYIVDIEDAYVSKASSSDAPAVSGDYSQSTENEDTFVYTVSPIEGAEYKIDDGIWQDSNVFDGITPESTHVFCVRIKETDNYFASEIGSLEVYFAKIVRADVPPISVEVSGESGNRTVTITPIDGAEYSFDNGNSWTDSNVLTGVNNGVINCAVRYKETATATASVMAEKQVDTAKAMPSAPEEFEIKFTQNPDGETLTASLPLLENALYSFDGINYSESNEKTDCLPDTVYTVYIKFAETEDALESLPTAVTVTSPSLIEYMKGDVNENGEIDSMDYVLLKRAYFGTYKLKLIEVGDINNSNNIDSMDYVFLKRAYFGTYVIK